MRMSMFENSRDQLNVGIDPNMNKTIAMPPLPEEPVEQVAGQEYEQEIEEAPEPVVVAQPQETVQQKNFRQLNEKVERAERERDDLLRKMQQIDAAKKPVVEEDYEVNLAPDDLAEGKH